MKTLLTKLSITIIPIITLICMVAFSAHAARTVGRHQNNESSQTENRAVTPANYGEVLNSMFGR